MRELVALDMYQTAGVGVLALLLGMFFTRTIPFLKRFCIPAIPIDFSRLFYPRRGVFI